MRMQAAESTFRYGLGWRHTLAQEHARVHGTFRQSRNVSRTAHLASRSRAADHKLLEDPAAAAGGAAKPSTAADRYEGAAQDRWRDPKYGSRDKLGFNSSAFMPGDLHGDVLEQAIGLDMQLYRWVAAVHAWHGMAPAHASTQAPACLCRR